VTRPGHSATAGVEGDSGPENTGAENTGADGGGQGGSGRREGGRREGGRGSRLRRRRRVLLGVGIAGVLLAGGGLIGASFVKSPQQLAADTAPPPQTATTATVASQVLTSSVQMRGVVYPSTQFDVYASAPESSTGTDTGSGDAGTGTGTSASGATGGVYISKLDVVAGKTIHNGEELAEIDGEPLFVLTGAVPAWRDVIPGESGPDVTELQKALASLGYYDGGDTPGYFGSATEYAVSLYYEHLGYTPPSSGGVPETNVVFLPSLPATVVAVNGTTGEQPGQPFMELAPKGALALTGELPPAYAAQVKPGLKVTIYDEVTGIHATGTVSNLGTATITGPTGTVVDIGGAPASASSGSTGSSSAGSSGSTGATAFIPLDVHPSTALAAALNGENVLVTVDTGQTEGPVLTVPVAAIVTTASGTSYVTVAGAHGKQRNVTVTPGISENGYVQVTPANSGALAAGDHVVVSG
jgi:Putative peptidoglycan binding domain/HlyD family secretion protein